MASAFKNEGMALVTTDNASANLYTASGVFAVVHAVYISNKSSTNEANVDVKVTTDGGSTFYHIGKSLRIPVTSCGGASSVRPAEASAFARISLSSSFSKVSKDARV